MSVLRAPSPERMIERRGIAIVLAIGLLLASLLLAFNNERLGRVEFQRQLTVQGQILAGSVAAALAFDDTITTQEYIDALHANPQIDAAGAYDQQGRLVAGFAETAPALPKRNAAGPPRLIGGKLEIRLAVVQNGTALGSVYVRAQTEDWTRRAARYVGIGIVLVMAALLVASLGSSYATQKAANRRLQEEMDARREAEEALRQSQKMEAMGQLTGGVAHDFNNLLMVASSGLELLERVQDGERRDRIKSGIRQAIDRGAKLTQQLLAFARRTPVKSEVIDLRMRIPDLRDMLDRSLREDVTVEIDLPDDLWPVEVDVAQLEVAMLNIAVNARDAMPDGGRICIFARNVPGKPDEVHLSVRDEGVGMPPEFIPQAFEPFVTTKGVGQGTGLGLSQVYGFARSSGGRAEIDSALGKGTTVTIVLPRSLATPPAPPAEPAPVEAGRSVQRHILMVEDDAHVAEFLSEMLQELGYDLSWKVNATEALAALEKGPLPDAVLSDMVMPGSMNGLDLARYVRRKWPDIPVMLMTGYSEAASAAAEQKIELLTKPYRMETLREKLARLFVAA